jgi:hypothetical protein
MYITVFVSVGAMYAGRTGMQKVIHICARCVPRFCKSSAALDAREHYVEGTGSRSMYTACSYLVPAKAAAMLALFSCCGSCMQSRPSEPRLNASASKTALSRCGPIPLSGL